MPEEISGIKQINTKEAFELYNKKITFVDVRSEEEYNFVFIPNTTLMTFEDLKKNLNKFDKSKEIVISCKCGYRSQIACAFLIKNGFDRNKVYNFRNGIDGWIKDNLPVISKIKL